MQIALSHCHSHSKRSTVDMPHKVTWLTYHRLGGTGGEEDGRFATLHGDPLPRLLNLLGFEKSFWGSVRYCWALEQIDDLTSI